LHRNQKPTTNDDDAPANSDYEFSPIHCSKCGRFLLLEAQLVGAIQVKCRRCKYWNLLESLPEEGLTSPTK